MSRVALLLSCAIHSGVFALAGWSSLRVAENLSPQKSNLTVSFGSEDRTLVSQDLPDTRPDLQTTSTGEPSFTPPAPTLEPPVSHAEIAEASPPSIPAAGGTPGKESSSSPSRKERGSRTASGRTGGRGFVPPAFLLRSRPAYPEQARAQHLEGVVLLLVSVDANGRVTNASIRQSCGHGMLDRAALEAVRSWRFSPARQGENKVPANVEVPIRFTFSE